MAVDRRKAVLFGTAAAVRLLLFTAFPGLPDLMTGRVEISTPVNSFKRLQEGLFLYNHNVSPYDGGVYFQSPLLLPLFSLLPDSAASPIFTYLLYILLDLLSANALMNMAESGEAGSSKIFSSPRRERRWSSVAIGALFLFNPFTIASCIGRPTSIFTTCAILYSIAKAVKGLSFTSMLALSFASYLSMYPLLLLPPILLLCHSRQPAKREILSQAVFIMRNTALVAGLISSLLYLSFQITGSWEFLSSTYGVQLLLPDLTPNVGLWWYFFIEMFDSFRSFFLAVFWLHLSSYVFPLTLRLRRQPLFAITTILGIFAVFKPYPSISDISLYFGLLSLYRHIMPLMRHTFLAGSMVGYCSVLGPAFYYLWIYAGSGNANFFYAITLVWSLGLSLLVADALYALLRDEEEVERPELQGKDLVQI